MKYVFDRTIEDVMRAIELRGKVTQSGITALTPGEQTEYLSGLKGAYNYQDLNRVEGNTQELAARLVVGGYAVDVSSPKTWTMADFPTAGELERIRQNIVALRAALKLHSSVPQTPSNLNPMDIGKANNIELIQYSINKALNAITSMLVNLGTFYMGEGGFLI